jgi:glycosyltransferase involved in cell wall biosynthesis
VRGFRIARDSGLDALLELRGATGSVAEEQQKGRLVALAGDDVEVGGPLPHGELPALFARSDLLINNHRAADKVVYEAAASCLPVLASAEAFAELLPDELRFHGAEQLAERLLALDRRRRPELRAAVEARHSVDHWADQLLAAVR